MINPIYEPLPETVTIAGEEYPVLTDFREWLNFADMLHDNAVEKKEQLSLMTLWFTEKVPQMLDSEAVEALFDFYGAGQLEPDKIDDETDEDEEAEPEETETKPPIFDWKIDARYIIGDFQRYYGIDLINIEYLHWWHFRALFASLPDESQCQKRMAYRSINLGSIKDAKERNRIARIQRQIAIPFECNDDAIANAFGGMML